MTSNELKESLEDKAKSKKLSGVELETLMGMTTSKSKVSKVEIVKEPKLVTMLLADSSIDSTTAERYKDMARLYLSDFEANLSSTSMKISQKYILYNMDEWNEWLSFPVVNKYLSKFKNEVLASMVDLSFAEGKATVAAVNLRQGLEQSNRTVNGNLIIFRLPEKDVADSVRYV